MLTTRKYGGFVQKVMNGNQAYVIEIKAEDVHHDIMSRVAKKYSGNVLNVIMNGYRL